MNQLRKVLIKLSGEALQGSLPMGIDPKMLDYCTQQMRSLRELGVQMALVVGGGNLFRGKTLARAGLGLVSADQMGMLATVMNALALRDALEQAGLRAEIMSALHFPSMTHPVDHRLAKIWMEEGTLVLFSGGTGNPFVTTDSAASLRAIQLQVDALLKATDVEGVFSEDPAHNPQARLYRRLSYQDVLKRELGVMDLSAFCQCRDHAMPIGVFNVHKPEALLRMVRGEEEGTWVSDRGEVL